MSDSTCEPSGSDLTSNKRLSFLLWQLPTIFFVIGFFTEAAFRTFLWAASFSVMGISCVNNARKCGRIHCYFIRIDHDVAVPFFLLGALALLVYGLGFFNFHNGWAIIGISIAVGAYFFRYVPEMILEKYKSGNEYENVVQT